LALPQANADKFSAAVTSRGSHVYYVHNNPGLQQIIITF